MYIDFKKNRSYNTHIAKINPFRYRGYYFDTDTGLYYLNSRYYDPQTRRFVNADDPSIPVLEQATDIGGLNLYSYCLNNPVKYADPDGRSIILLIIIGAFAVVGATIAGVVSYNNGSRGWDLFADIVLGFFMGAAAGGLVVSGYAGIYGAIHGATAIIAGKVTAAGAFAIGALAYNTTAIIVAPLYDIQMEPIEVDAPASNIQPPW